MTDIVKVDKRNGATIARIVNVPNLDLFNMVRVREALEVATEDQPTVFILDLKKVEYVDSSGLGLIITMKLRCDAHGGKFYLAGVTSKVLKMFQLTGVDAKIRIFDTVNDVLANVEVRDIPEQTES